MLFFIYKKIHKYNLDKNIDEKPLIIVESL
jgi:hypothetical protein